MGTFNSKLDVLRQEANPADSSHATSKLSHPPKRAQPLNNL